MTIDIDGEADGTPLERVWSFFGYDEVNYTTSREGERLLRTLVRANTAPVRVRTHFLFNTGDGTPALKWGSTNLYTEDATGAAVYDYSLIDSILDATVAAGAEPFIELGFMPRALSTRPDPYENSSPYVLDGGSFYPPSSYEAWADLVRTWAEHAAARYPGAPSWQWELWNEPDIGYWQGTFEEYARLYDHTEAALHAALPGASLGGPAVANPDNGFLEQFLEHCSGGTNAVTGASGTRLDMVSFHAKGGVFLEDGHVQMDLGNQLRLHREGFRRVAASGAFATTPIVISEADPDGCAACPVSTAPHHAYRNAPAYGAYEVAMMKRSLDLASEQGVQLRGVLTWSFTFPGTPYFAGYRALSTNGIHLPVLGAFQLLGRLRGNRLPIQSTGALPLDTLLQDGVRGQPDVDALGSRDGSRIQILVWHYHDDLLEGPPARIALRVALPSGFGSGAVLTHLRVDEAHGNAHAVWQTQGSPDAPSASQLAELGAAMQPVALERASLLPTPEGRVELSFELPRFGVSLLTLEPASRVDGPRGEPAGSTREAGCSCHLPRSPRRGSPLAPLALCALLAHLLRRRRAPTDRSSA